MKPHELYTEDTKNSKFYESTLKRVKAIEKADENVQCSIENIESAYLTLARLGLIIQDFPKVPVHIKKQFNATKKYIKTESKALNKYLKELKIPKK